MAEYEIVFVDNDTQYIITASVQGEELTVKGIDGTLISILPPPTTFIPTERIKVSKLEETSANQH